MRLTEFALDLDYVVDEENIKEIMINTHCNLSEALAHDYEANWRWKRKSFENQTRCIASFFSRILGGYTTEDTRKMLIKCVARINGEVIKDFSGGFCDVQVLFDYSFFSTLNELEKKRVTLETLMSGVRKVATVKKWDMSPFEKAYTQIIKAEYKNEWILKKPIKSPDNNATACIFIEHEVTKVDIIIIVCDITGKEILREKVITDLPNEWVYSQYLGIVEWRSSKEVVLISKGKDSERAATIPLCNMGDSI